MISFAVNRDFTRDSDQIISDEKGIPHMYIGRGAYSGKLEIYHFVQDIKKVHLLYVGRYTAIAQNLKIYSDYNHDIRSMYMGVIPEYAHSESEDTRLKCGQSARFMDRKGMTVIGNDVWIGDDVTIVSDVVIGDGAVVAARSVVTKDIPPYTIWGGNPARQIGRRFDEALSDTIRKVAWWEFDKETLARIEDDMRGDPQDFANKYGPKYLERYKNYTEQKECNAGGIPTMAAFVDMDTQYSTLCDVIDAFCEKFADRSARLRLYYITGNEIDEEAVKVIRSLVDEISRNAEIELIGISEDEEESVICQSDYFILGRDIRNISRIGYAMKYDVKLLSGVDIPMFRNASY